jgi:hypothetical protein
MSHPIKELKSKLDMSDGNTESITNSLGYFGNIWVRSNYLAKKGENNGGGHRHNFDHISLLVKGKVLVEVDGYDPKEFTAPTFIMVKRQFKHKFTALTDDVCWYCVFALRDVDGDVTEIYSGDNSPYDSVPDGKTLMADLKKLESDTSQH